MVRFYDESHDSKSYQDFLIFKFFQSNQKKTYFNNKITIQNLKEGKRKGKITDLGTVRLFAIDELGSVGNSGAAGRNWLK